MMELLIREIFVKFDYIIIDFIFDGYLLNKKWFLFLILVE